MASDTTEMVNTTMKLKRSTEIKSEPSEKARKIWLRGFKGRVHEEGEEGEEVIVKLTNERPTESKLESGSII